MNGDFVHTIRRRLPVHLKFAKKRQVAVLKRTNSFRDKFERYIARDRHNAHLRRKAYTAIAAKMARTVHAVVKHGEPYRPFFEGASPGGRTLV